VRPHGTLGRGVVGLDRLARASRPTCADRGRYPPYNLPGSVLHWITHNDVQEDFVVKLDGDMVLRKPFTAEEVGALKGAPVGGYYGYLHGVDNGMVRGIRPVSRLSLSRVCVAACHPAQRSCCEATRRREAVHCERTPVRSCLYTP